MWIIGVGFQAVRNVVTRYCALAGVQRFRPYGSPLPPPQEQEPISSFCKRLRSWGSPDAIADKLQNRQRTLNPPAPSILKAEAGLRFADCLREQGIEYFQDVAGLAPERHAAVGSAIRLIPGQGTGHAWDAVRMVSGDEDKVLPTRMVQRFIRTALGRDVDLDTATDLVHNAARSLRRSYPQLTPRLLDNEIWKYQRRTLHTPQ